jgi:hypothetical protein
MAPKAAPKPKAVPKRRRITLAHGGPGNPAIAARAKAKAAAYRGRAGAYYCCTVCLWPRWVAADSVATTRLRCTLPPHKPPGCPKIRCTFKTSPAGWRSCVLADAADVPAWQQRVAAAVARAAAQEAADQIQARDFWPTVRRDVTDAAAAAPAAGADVAPAAANA